MARKKFRGILPDSDGGGIRSGGWDNADAPVTIRTKTKSKKQDMGEEKRRLPTVEELEEKLAENLRTDRFGYGKWTAEQWEESWKNW